MDGRVGAAVLVGVVAALFLMQASTTADKAGPVETTATVGHGGLVASNAHHPPPSTKLMLAARDGDLGSVTELLAAGELAGYTDASGFSALIWACLGGHLDIVDSLLAAGAAVNPSPGTHTPLRGAVNRNHAVIVERLLRAGADVNIPSAGNRTPLMGAAMFGHDDLLRTLLAAGANAEVRNSFGESASDLAQSEVARALLTSALAPKPASARRRSMLGPDTAPSTASTSPPHAQGAGGVRPSPRTPPSAPSRDATSGGGSPHLPARPQPAKMGNAPASLPRGHTSPRTDRIGNGRRVFMWMWGTPADLLLDASIAAAHNRSITDVVLECGFGITPPFDIEHWGNVSACERPSEILHMAGIRTWLTLESTGSMGNVSVPLRQLWSAPDGVLPGLKTVAAKLGAHGWNMDFECDGTPADFELYLGFLGSVKQGMADEGLEVLIDANGDPCTANYTALARSGLVLDMSLYYEAWPLDWKTEAHECLDPGSSRGSGSAGRACMPGLACYKQWPASEVAEKIDFVAGLGAMQIGVFTLAGQDHYPEDYWWPLLERFLLMAPPTPGKPPAVLTATELV